MRRKTFLTLTACIALGVGLFALTLPAALLASKGVAPSLAAEVWVREVGALLVPLGVMSLLMRGEPDSGAMRAFLLGNMLVHLGLLPIEALAFARGVITRLDGIAPNTALHVVMAAGFAHFALRARRELTS